MHDSARYPARGTPIVAELPRRRPGARRLAFMAGDLVVLAAAAAALLLLCACLNR